MEVVRDCTLQQDRMFSYINSAHFHLTHTPAHISLGDYFLFLFMVRFYLNTACLPVSNCGPPEKAGTLGEAAPFRQGQTLELTRTSTLSVSVLKWGTSGSPRRCLCSGSQSVSSDWQHHLGDASPPPAPSCSY